LNEYLSPLFISFKVGLKECAENLHDENVNFEKWTFLNV